MATRIDPIVAARAGHRCEYCGIPELYARCGFCIDHIIAKQHRGGDELENLAYCCISCNLNKGPNISSTDPLDFSITRLFNPRKDRWSAHFRWDGPILIGLTPVGRATVQVLSVNQEIRVLAREELMLNGEFPLTLDED